MENESVKNILILLTAIILTPIVFTIGIMTLGIESNQLASSPTIMNFVTGVLFAVIYHIARAIIRKDKMTKGILNSLVIGLFLSIILIVFTSIR